MADVNMYSIMLWSLSNKMYSAEIIGENAENVQAYFKANLSVLVNNLQNNQFNVIKARILLDARRGVST